jgi:hypothetical protein
MINTEPHPNGKCPQQFAFTSRVPGVYCPCVVQTKISFWRQNTNATFLFVLPFVL